MQGVDGGVVVTHGSFSNVGSFIALASTAAAVIVVVSSVAAAALISAAG